MTEIDSGSPGNHPHSDRPNWRPGDDDVDELKLQKFTDALRNGMRERQIAKLLGLSRTRVWRMKLIAKIPEPLCDRLGEAWRSGAIRRLSAKSWAAIGRLIRKMDEEGDDAQLRGEVECCPNCAQLAPLAFLVGTTRFEDGHETCTSVFCKPDALDYKRGEQLARKAYTTLRKKTPPRIVAGYFVVPPPSEMEAAA